MPRQTKPSSSPISHRSKQAKDSNVQAKHMKECGLKEYTQLYFKYIKLFEEQPTAMRYDRERAVCCSCESLCGNHSRAGKQSTYRRPNPEQIQNNLRELAQRCEAVPQSNFEDRIRIGLAANAYIRTMIEKVVAGPGKPRKDWTIVLGERTCGANALTQNSMPHSPPPAMTHVIVELTPEPKASTRLVAEQDVASWRSNPGQLVGKGPFISAEIVRSVFVVVDFAMKQVKGPQYDVVYEDSGVDDILVVVPDTLFEMVSRAEIITNMED